MGWLIVKDEMKTTWLNSDYISFISLHVDEKEASIEITMENDYTYEYWTDEEDMVGLLDKKPHLISFLLQKLKKGEIVDLHEYLKSRLGGE